MSEHHKVKPDGILGDGVPFDPFPSPSPPYLAVRQQLAAFRIPILVHANSPHERLYIAALDGTDNDAIHDPEHITNVGLVARQIQALDNPRISGGYVAGPGTQQHAPVANLIDGMVGYSVEERAEELYKQFITQAWKWKQRDPEAKISVVSVSFSRGGEVAALFARLVEERGIQNPSGATYTYGMHHQIKHVEYSKPPLIPPHTVAQGVAMFDPVGTGHALHVDRRLPPSVLSGLQLIALDEPRSLFKSDHIIDPGITPDGRFAGVYVPGAHADDGGSYHRDGLSIRSGNIIIDYLNGFSDTPILIKQAEPDDPRLNVVHHSEQGKLVYRLTPKVDRLDPDGYHELQVPRRMLGHVPDAYNAEPRNAVLDRQFERQPMPNTPAPTVPSPQQNTPKSDLDRWIECLYRAAQNPDPRVWDQVQQVVVNAYLDSPDGRLFQQQADALAQRSYPPLEAQPQQAAPPAMLIQPQQPSPALCQ